jgi:hypothetical protein
LQLAAKLGIHRQGVVVLDPSHLDQIGVEMYSKFFLKSSCRDSIHAH